MICENKNEYINNFYDDRSDVHSFIRKSRVDDCFKIKNDTKNVVDLRVKLESKKDASISEFKITLAPSDIYTYTTFDETRLRDVLMINPENETNGYLNPVILISGILRINIQEKPNRFFLYAPHYDFVFKMKKFDDIEYPDGSSGLTEFQKFYNNCFSYINYLISEEGIESLQVIDKQRNNLYVKNNMATLLKQNPNLLDSPVYKIPLRTHKVWVTSYDNPTDPSDQYIRWFENSIEHNPISEGWVHYFWIENKHKQEKLFKKLQNHPSITVMELENLNFETGPLYKNILKKKAHGYTGQASDVIRLELLKQFGGFYLDTDYEVFQSLKPYSKVYDLVVGLDPMSPFLGNAFMASHTHHPFLAKSLELIKRNFSKKAPPYVNRKINDNITTLALTGPVMVTVAFTSSAGKGENIDIVLPPQSLYPTTDGFCPTKEIVVPDGRLPAQCIGAHYWDNAWTDPRFVG